MRHLFYLHGFGSSPDSNKARFLDARLRRYGIEVRCPDLNEPDFSTLTTTRMIAQVEREMAGLPPGPVSLIGSSLGGFLAFQLAVRQAADPRAALAVQWPIDRLILLAPALDFGRTGFGSLGAAALERWRAIGCHEFMHYATGQIVPVRYSLYEDAQSYDSFREMILTPTLIFHGKRDEVVEPAMVQRFAAARSAVSLRLMDDDHMLGANLELIWAESARFLGLRQASPGKERG